MPTPDKYSSFDELCRVEQEGRDYMRWILQNDPKLLILAPHGGGIEPGTSEIARALAGSAFSCYTFEGLKSGGNEFLHITSTRFDDPLCISLIDECQLVVTVHGCNDNSKCIFVGGLHHELQRSIIASLSEKGFDAQTAGESYPGSEAANLCNRGQLRRGVQLEISNGMRKEMFMGLNRQGRQITKPAFFSFVETIRSELFTLKLDK